MSWVSPSRERHISLTEPGPYTVQTSSTHTNTAHCLFPHLLSTITFYPSNPTHIVSYCPSSRGQLSVSGVLLSQCSFQGPAGQPWSSSPLLHNGQTLKSSMFHSVKMEQDGKKSGGSKSDGLLPGYQAFSWCCCRPTCSFMEIINGLDVLDGSVI